MKLSKKAIVFSVVSVLLLCVSELFAVYISGIICTIWIIVMIIKFGMKGGLFFTLAMSVSTAISFLTKPSYEIFFAFMGIITYLSMSVGIGLPIELMKKEQANRIASEEKLRRITDNLQDVIIQMGRHGIIKYISTSCVKVFGQPSDYYVGKNFYSEIHPEDYKEISEKIESAFDEI